MSSTHTINALTTIDEWTELASRDNDGLAVFLFWSKATDRIKVLVVDGKHDEALEFDVLGADALRAFHHPFAYAAAEASASATRRASPSICNRRAERSTR